MEQKHRRQMRLGKIERAVLASLLVPGVIVLAVVAGNAVQLLKYADPKKRQRFSYKIPEIVRRLSEKGLVRVRSERGTPVVELTGRGKQTVELIEAGRAKIKNVGKNVRNPKQNAQYTVLRRLHYPDQQKSKKSDKNNIQIITDGIDNNIFTGRLFDEIKNSI